MREILKYGAERGIKNLSKRRFKRCLLNNLLSLMENAMFVKRLLARKS